uniref:Glycosyltransferase family 92 protein n=1 Tax=Ditylenchus dipsaci TaxID=166011 RepID=A0A915E7C3_9BILA
MQYLPQQRSKYVEWFIEEGKNVASFQKRYRRELGRHATATDAKRIKEWYAKFQEGDLRNKKRVGTKYARTPEKTAEVVQLLEVLPHSNSSLLSQPYISSVRQAEAAIKYLYDLQKGKAEVAAVVEAEKCVDQTANCYFFSDPKPEIGILREAGKWVKNEQLHVFSAYLDERPNSLFPVIWSVQILASSFGDSDDKEPFYCHIFFDQKDWSKKVVVKPHFRMVWQKAWDPRSSFYNAFLVTCPIPKDQSNSAASYVAISHQYCGSSQILNLTKVQTQANLPKISTPSSKVPLIGVCVKGLDYMDENELAARKLVEWIELNYVLGAEHITLYSYYIPARLRKVLEFYSKEGRLNLIDIELPGNQPNQNYIRHEYIWRNRQQKRRNELIPYNDCFYRYAVSNFDFVLIIDTDEVVVPLNHPNWQLMLQSMLPSLRAPPSAISVRNIFKFSSQEESILDIPLRSATIQDKEQYGKSFISAKNIASVFNHFALHRLHRNVSRTVYLEEDVAVKLHFRPDCPDELKGRVCERLKANLTHDYSLDTFVVEVRERVDKVLNQLRIV